MSDESHEVDVTELAEVFRKLGASDPEAWARAQIEEGTPQLARFLFLRQAWQRVVSEDDPHWIEEHVSHAETDPDAPYAGVGHALKSLRARGATNDELIDLVRGAQAELLFELCSLLDDHRDDAREPEAEHVSWELLQVDDEGAPVDVINGLHESVLETDPTGREMRPRRQPT